MAEHSARRQMKHPKLVLTQKQKGLVCRAIQDHCRHRQWRLYAISCYSNHVHVLLSADSHSPERAMIELKAYATRYLRRDGSFEIDRIWTRHGSTRYVNTQEHLLAAIRYIESH